MYPHELIGKLAVRTAPIDYGPSDGGLFGDTIVAVNNDYSYTTDPIRILAATESHIVYQRQEPMFEGKPMLLNSRWVDNNWTDYDALMALASPEHIARMQSLGVETDE